MYLKTQASHICSVPLQMSVCTFLIEASKNLEIEGIFNDVPGGDAQKCWCPDLFLQPPPLSLSLSVSSFISALFVFLLFCLSLCVYLFLSLSVL